MRGALLVFLGACSAQSADLAARPGSTAPPVDPARAPTTTRDLPGYPPALEPAQASRCVLSGGWPVGQTRELRFADGRVFSKLVRPTHAELSLLDAPSAFVELVSDTARMAGFVARDGFVIHAAKPFVVAGFAAPGPTAALRWLGTKDRTITVEVTLPPR
jgi:hypothetical protein